MASRHTTGATKGEATSKMVSCFKPGTNASYAVLLVDDEPLLLNALVRSLRKQSYQIYTAHSAEDAMDILRTCRVDLVVSDERMAGIGGSEFLSWVAEKFPQVVRFLLTGDPYLPAALCATDDGRVNRYFTKPCPLGELAIAIRHSLEEKDRCRAGSFKEKT